MAMVRLWNDGIVVRIGKGMRNKTYIYWQSAGNALFYSTYPDGTIQMETIFLHFLYVTNELLFGIPCMNATLTEMRVSEVFRHFFIPLVNAFRQIMRYGEIVIHFHLQEDKINYKFIS